MKNIDPRRRDKIPYLEKANLSLFMFAFRGTSTKESESEKVCFSRFPRSFSAALANPRKASLCEHRVS